MSVCLKIFCGELWANGGVQFNDFNAYDTEPIRLLVNCNYIGQIAISIEKRLEMRLRCMKDRDAMLSDRTYNCMRVYACLEVGVVHLMSARKLL